MIARSGNRQAMLKRRARCTDPGECVAHQPEHGAVTQADQFEVICSGMHPRPRLVPRLRLLELSRYANQQICHVGAKTEAGSGACT
jgi:hypothetical protein